MVRQCTRIHLLSTYATISYACGHLLRNALLRSGTLPTGTLRLAAHEEAAAAVKLGPIALFNERRRRERSGEPAECQPAACEEPDAVSQPPVLGTRTGTLLAGDAAGLSSVTLYSRLVELVGIVTPCCNVRHISRLRDECSKTDRYVAVLAYHLFVFERYLFGFFVF